MKVFITGGTGFVGRVVVKELLANSVDVLGLARSEASSQKLISWGAQSIRGSLSDLSTLTSAATQADAVIHLGFSNDFNHFVQAGRQDETAIRTMGRAIAGTNKPLVITYGTTGIRRHTQFEHDVTNSRLAKLVNPRKSEIVARQLIDAGVNAFVVRLPPAVHGAGDQGFTQAIITRAEKVQRAEYFKVGQHSWSAVHRLDAAHLFYLVTMYGLENPTTNERIFSAVADGAVAMSDLAQVISKKLAVPLVPSYNPVRAGRLSLLYLINCPASSLLTQHELGWRPAQPDLLSDIISSVY